MDLFTSSLVMMITVIVLAMAFKNFQEGIRGSYYVHSKIVEYSMVGGLDG